MTENVKRDYVQSCWTRLRFQGNHLRTFKFFRGYLNFSGSFLDYWWNFTSVWLLKRRIKFGKLLQSWVIYHQPVSNIFIFFLVSCDYLHILVVTWKVSVAYLGIKTVPNKNVWYLVIFCQDFYEQVSVFWDSYWVLAQFFEGTMGISMVSSDISSFLKGFSAELEDYDTFFNQSSRWFFFFFLKFTRESLS